MGKKVVFIVASVWIVTGIYVSMAAAEGPSCKEMILDTCIGCHEKDRICDKLGKSKKSWKSILKFMIANGADLSSEQVEMLSDCMSEPAAEAVAACADILPADTDDK